MNSPEETSNDNGTPLSRVPNLPSSAAHDRDSSTPAQYLRGHPIDPIWYFRNHTDELAAFYNCVEEVTHPGCTSPKFNPHQAYVWAPTLSPSLSQEDSDTESPCATIYDKGGTIVQIDHQGACACLNNDELGICLESLPAIIECAIKGAVATGHLPHDKDAALKFLYTHPAYRDPDNVPLIDDYIANAKGLTRYLGGENPDTDALYRDLQFYIANIRPL